MILSLSCQITALLFETIHLWQYSYDGEGFTVLEILAKISGATSEVTMSMLLVLMAQGWTVTYQDLDVDDNLEIFIPTFALIVMVHVLVSALTFIDVDATHKYHDFSGIQGWVLLLVKVGLFAYFCYQHHHC